MLITKRDGRKVEFEPDKIYKAIKKANEKVPKTFQISNDQIRSIQTNIVERYVPYEAEITVEKIQDQVELNLVNINAYYVAKEYITYRYLHNMARENYNELMNEISIKINAKNVLNQNANVDEHSFGGRVGETSDLVLKRYALDYCMSKMARDNHLNNMIYIHDLNSYAVGSHNCLTVPFSKLLKNGFNTRQTDVRPAQSINSAFQLIAVIFQLQSLQQFGGVSAGSLDWTMIPYVRKSFYKHFRDGMEFINDTMIEEDEVLRETYYPELPIDSKVYLEEERVYKFAMKMTIKEANQSVEAMYHNLNTLQSRSGNQLPFTSINYGTCTLPEGRLIIRALLEGSIKGIGKLHRTSIFPCGIFQVGKGINKSPNDPNYDLFRLALQSTAKRLYPNYANIDWSGNAGYDKNDPTTYFATMGCRTANGFDINGLGQKKDGRGNICPVTIILPELAAQVAQLDKIKDVSMPCQEEVIELFFTVLDKKIHEAKDMLIERFEWICSQKYESAKFMYENGLMEGYDGKEIRSALKHGTLAVGMLGINEVCMILLGKDITSKEGIELTERILQLYKDRCSEFKTKYSLNFGVYATPAENLCHTSMNKFKEKYGIIEGVSDKSYFTNSFHIPVYKEVNAFEKIDIESKFCPYTSAGCITYIEIGANVTHNIDALEKLVIYAMDKDIPYFAINIPNDTCMECGECGQIDNECPVCKSTHINRLRRVTGYLTGDYKSAFNKGKQEEAEMRVKHLE